MKRKLFIFVPVVLLLVLLVTLITPTVTMSESISSNVFRLHIIANSDTKEDQALKLKVRNEILELSDGLFDNCNSIEEAIEIAENNKELLTMATQKIIVDNGYDYSVKVSTAKDYFKTRYYDSFTLPSGMYDCLKIEIGEGKGHNWWCVLFPSVCISGCTEDFEGVLTEEEIEMITSDDYVIRFKAVELFEKIKKEFEEL